MGRDRRRASARYYAHREQAIAERADRRIKSNRTTVYLWYDLDNTVIYVGQTVNPKNRESAHARKAPWFDRVAYAIDWDVPADQLDAVEAHLIHKFHPVGNKVCPLCDAVALFSALAVLDTCEA